jgi:hypothetical protein
LRVHAEGLVDDAGIRQDGALVDICGVNAIT